jgi:hypothetical protein
MIVVIQPSEHKYSNHTEAEKNILEKIENVIKPVTEKADTYHNPVWLTDVAGYKAVTTSKYF